MKVYIFLTGVISSSDESSLARGSVESTQSSETFHPERGERTMAQGSAESAQSREICQPIIQAECNMPVNQEPYSRKSKRLEGKSVEGMYSDMMLEDIEDSSSSDDEMTNESDSDVDSENENLTLDKEKRREKRSRIPLTDNESGDEEWQTELLKKRQSSMYKKINEKLQGSVVLNKWIPDAQDKVDLHKHIVQPMTTRCSKVTHCGSTIPVPTLEKIRNEQPLDNEDKPHVAKTGYDYAYGMERLMYILQEKAKIDDPQLLSHDQKLHIRQFFLFKHRTFLAPMNIIDLLEKNIDSPNVKGKAYEAYKCILNEMLLEASSLRGKSKFISPVSEEEKAWDEAKQVEKGLKKQRLLLNDIRNVIAEMQAMKPFALWRGQRDDEKKLKNDNERIFEGRSTPDPIMVIEKWLSHEKTREMDRIIFEAAKNGSIVSGTLLNKITQHLIIRFNMNIGSRPEIWKKICWFHFHEGVAKGPAAFPYKHPKDPNLDSQNSDISKRMMMEDGQDTLYVREDPWGPDPFDLDDPMQSDQSFLKGVCVTIKNHKTGSKYPFYCWFSKVDVLFLLRYEEICQNFAAANGFELTSQSPMFINSKGKCFLNNNHKNLDLSEFSAIVDIPKATEGLFRKMFTNVVYKHGSALVKQAESIALTHSQDVALQSYVDPELKRSMSFFVNSWFRKAASVSENIGKLQVTYNSDKQAERMKNGLKEVDEYQLQDWIQRVDCRDSGKLPTLQNTITDKIKAALLNLLRQVSEVPITVSKLGSPLEIFLTGTPVLRHKNISIMLRTFYFAPLNWECRSILEENLLTFASLMANERITVRDLEVKWTLKLLNCLDFMRRGKNIESKAVQYFFYGLCLKFEYKYCLNNNALINQLKHWIAKHNEREKKRDHVYGTVASLGQEAVDHDDSISKTTVTCPNSQNLTVTRPNELEFPVNCPFPQMHTVNRHILDDHTVNCPIFDDQTDQDETVNNSNNGDKCERPTRIVAISQTESREELEGPFNQNMIDDDITLSTGINDDITSSTGNTEIIESDMNTSTSIPRQTDGSICRVISGDCHQLNVERTARLQVITPEKISAPLGVRKCVATPKVNRFGKVWNDMLKLELLRQFILYAKDPMISYANDGYQRHLAEECKEIRDCQALVKGKYKAWKEFTTAGTMGDKLYRHGFDSQMVDSKDEKKNGNFSTGLYKIILDVVGQSASNSELRMRVEEVMNVAKAVMNRVIDRL